MSQKVTHRSTKTDITTARGVRLAPFQASSTWYGPPPSLYVLVRHPSSNGGSVVSNVRKLGRIKFMSQKVPYRSVKTDLTIARGVRLTPCQAPSTWYGPPPSLYALVWLLSSNGGSVVSNVRKLVLAKFRQRVPYRSVKTDITAAVSLGWLFFKQMRLKR